MDSLPVDLERELFETAAICNPKMIPTLMRVCRRFRTWLEPLLYRVLIAHVYVPGPTISAALSKPTSFLKTAVRHVFLRNGSITMKEANKKILSSCEGIINLTYSGTLDSELLPLLDKMHLRKLDFSVPSSSMGASAWADSTLKHSLFRSVTHLSLYQNVYETPAHSSWQDWFKLASLPSLSHLSVSQELSAILPHALAECPHLILAIILFWTMGPSQQDTARQFAEGLAFTDPRLLVMVTMSILSKDWEIGARGGDDYWARAEKFVAAERKSAPDVPRSICYILDETNWNSGS
ncbi:hypothetical protein B0H16DRAFT_1522140 [Mycena metata]|uniref:F-box domain-containing protein n=1 Tax=Mycena metata TaxID=1033252 RepID=A0AAD7NM00_9AGAR|nr:hypothetical protein B0H16DRAFT_1522140 [Mycena metata]